MDKVLYTASAAKTIYGCGEVSLESWYNYACALLTIAGADDEVSDKEMEWLMKDFVAIIDAPDEFIYRIQQFEYKKASLETILPQISFDVRINYKRALLYDAIKMSFADQVYAAKEREAVKNSAELLGVPFYLAKTLEGLVNTEKSIEATRRSIFELDTVQPDSLGFIKLPGTRKTSRIIQHTFGIDQTSDDVERFYGYALMIIAGADGEVSEGEKNWYKYEFAPMAKVPAYVVEDVVDFDYKGKSLDEVIRHISDNLSMGYAKTMLYNAIKMSRADDDFPKAERDAVEEAAGLLGIPISIANTMNYLIDAEDKVEKMRKTLFEVKSTQ